MYGLIGAPGCHSPRSRSPARIPSRVRSSESTRAPAKLDLFEAAAVLAAQLRAGTTQIVAPRRSIPYFLRCPLDHRPDRPATDAGFDMTAFRDHAQQPSLLNPRRGPPGVDPLLRPNWEATVRIRLPFPSLRDRPAPSGLHAPALSRRRARPALRVGGQPTRIARMA